MRRILYLILPLVLFTACNFSTSMLVSPGKQEVPAEGGNFVVSLVTADEEPNWTAECDSVWVTLSKYKGNGDAKITVTVSKNKRKTARSASIKFKGSKNSVFVHVLQEGNPNSGGNEGGNGEGGEGGNGEGGEGGNEGGEGGNGEGGNGGGVKKGDIYFELGDLKLVFAPGNLQYNAAKDEWRFAPHQYDMIGNDNDKIAYNYDGWIDLFGWATSGYMGSEPYLTTLDNTQYGPQGEHINIYEEPYTEYDWGVHIGDKITNNPDKSYKWRSMKSWEWHDGILRRCQHTLATVCGEKGLLVFPIGFEVDESKLSMEDYLHMVIKDESYLTDNGLLFLPAAGRREGTKLITETTGWYHTSIGYLTGGCVFLEFYSERDAEQQDWGVTTCGEPYGRHIGGAVRLVREIE